MEDPTFFWRRDFKDEPVDLLVLHFANNVELTIRPPLEFRFAYLYDARSCEPPTPQEIAEAHEWADNNLAKLRRWMEKGPPP